MILSAGIKLLAQERMLAELFAVQVQLMDSTEKSKGGTVMDFNAKTAVAESHVSQIKNDPYASRAQSAEVVPAKPVRDDQEAYVVATQSGGGKSEGWKC